MGRPKSWPLTLIYIYCIFYARGLKQSACGKEAWRRGEGVCLSVGIGKLRLFSHSSHLSNLHTREGREKTPMQKIPYAPPTDAFSRSKPKIAQNL